jgi:hypothetical protein
MLNCSFVSHRTATKRGSQLSKASVVLGIAARMGRIFSSKLVISRRLHFLRVLPIFI